MPGPVLAGELWRVHVQNLAVYIQQPGKMLLELLAFFIQRRQHGGSSLPRGRRTADFKTGSPEKTVILYIVVLFFTDSKDYRLTLKDKRNPPAVSRANIQSTCRGGRKNGAAFAGNRRCQQALSARQDILNTKKENANAACRYRLSGICPGIGRRDAQSPSACFPCWLRQGLHDEPGRLRESVQRQLRPSSACRPAIRPAAALTLSRWPTACAGAASAEFAPCSLPIIIPRTTTASGFCSARRRAI